MAKDMSDSLPISIAILVLVVNAIYSAKVGIVTILSAGFATIVAAASFLFVFQFLPGILDTFFDFSPGRRSLTWMGVIISLVVFVLVRFPILWGLRRLLGPDSKFHAFADGFPAAVLSVLPSTIVILFLFSCFRIAGTIQELHYVASLGREGIEHNGGRIPPYPRAGVWREEIESIPGVQALLHPVDPFSRAASRNLAAVVLLDQAGATRAFFSSQSETASLFAEEAVRDLDQSPSIRRALQSGNRVALVLDPVLRERAMDSQLSPVLKELQLRPVLERFVTSLAPPPETSPPTPSN